MRYRKLDENGDYSFGRGDADFLKDSADAVAQAVLTRLRLWVGEWFLDVEEGTAYQQGILGKTSKATADATIRDRILKTEGVNSIVNYSSSLDDVSRTLSVSVTIDTIYGQTVISEVL